MKRALILCMAFLLLAGCSGSPAPSVTPAPTKTIAATAPQTPGLDPSPTVMPDEACSEEDYEDEVVFVVDTSKENGARFSNVAVTDGVYVYYREDVYKEVIPTEDDPYEDSYYYYQKIMRFDSATGKAKTLRNLDGKGFLNELLLGKDNTLYYVMAENNCPEAPSTLYEYRPDGKDIPLVRDVCSDIYVENDCLCYYSGDGYASEAPELVSFDPSTGQIAPVDESTFGDIYLPADRRYDISAVHRGAVTDIFVIENESQKTTELRIPVSSGYFVCAFVYMGSLYIVNCDYDRCNSVIFRIDLSNGSIVAKTPVDALIGGNVFYKGKWYCHTYKQEEDEEEGIVVTDEKIGAYDPLTGEYTFIKEKGVVSGDMSGFILEAGCGYLWTFWCEETDGVRYEYKGKIKIP